MSLPIPFGNPKTYAGHSGVDYPVARGTVFRASGPGRVSHWGSSTRGGFYIWVQYDNGPLVGYHHMDSHKGCPAAGTRVSEGTQLGYVGSLGQNSTGPHLHSEVAGHATTAGYWKFFDRNRVVGSKPAGDKPTPIAPTTPRRKPAMSHIYHKLNTSPILYTEAGASPGTPANWKETTDQGLANAWLRQNGSPVPLESIGLNAQTWDNYKTAYLAPLRVDFSSLTIPAPAAGIGDPAAIAAAVDAALADDFAKVNANIDDQPTTFKITPEA